MRLKQQSIPIWSHQFFQNTCLMVYFRENWTKERWVEIHLMFWKWFYTDKLNEKFQLAKLRYFIEVSSQHLGALNIVGSVKKKKKKKKGKLLEKKTFSSIPRSDKFCINKAGLLYESNQMITEVTVAIIRSIILRQTSITRCLS